MNASARTYCAGVPLLSGDRLLGVLHIDTGQPHRFTPTELRLLQRVAEYVSLAIDRALLYQAEREARREAERRTQHTRVALDALLNLAGAIVSAPATAGPPDMPESRESPDSLDDLDTTSETALPDAPPSTDMADMVDIDVAGTDDEPLHHLARLCCQLIDCERVAIIAVDPSTDHLRPVTVSGSSPGQEQRFRESFRELRLAERFGAQAAAQLRAGETVLLDVRDLGADHPAHILSQRFFLLAPMLAAGRLTGYLGVNFGDEVSDYTPEHRALARAAAQLVGTVMERQRLAHEREEARTDALSWERAKRQMDEFLSIAGHELRTPMTSAKANVQFAARLLERLLQMESNGETPAQGGQAKRIVGVGPLQTVHRAHDLLQRAARQFARQERLINDLLDISRIDAGKLEFRLATRDLADLVRDSVEEQRAAHPDRVISLSVSPSAPASAPDQPEHPLLVYADSDRLIQVTDNLLTNALKYSGSDAPVSVRVTADGNLARCEVTDHGPGLRIEEQQRIWQRFYRVSGVDPQAGSGLGLGLGLYICKTIIERHGGRIGVESTPGAGATFWFTLPLSRTHAA